jgi:hypothetical protein
MQVSPHGRSCECARGKYWFYTLWCSNMYVTPPATQNTLNYTLSVLIVFSDLGANTTTRATKFISSSLERQHSTFYQVVYLGCLDNPYSENPLMYTLHLLFIHFFHLLNYLPHTQIEPRACKQYTRPLFGFLWSPFLVIMLQLPDIC